MKVHWHCVPFTHRCGKQGTVIEIAMRSDGIMAIGGLCAVCGEEFTEEFRLVDILASCAIFDYKKELVVEDVDLMANFVPVGKPH